MNWTEIKNRIYDEDGSLRDIYVLQTDLKDWEKWIDLVNNKYEVKFYDAKTDITKDKIDITVVKEYWSDKNKELITATIKLGAININCHLFDNSEIENDIDPREFKTIQDHLNLLSYLKDISAALNKDVLLTEENTKDSILLRCRQGDEFV